MKIFAFTDIHGDIETLKKIVERVNKDDIDIVISCGDLSYFGNGIEEVFKQLSKIKKTVLLISGTHESHDDVEYYCKKYANCININYTKHTYQDHIFVGYGDGGFGDIDPKLKLLSKKFKTFFNEHKGKKVLVLHGPPYGTKCDNRSAWYSDERYNGSKTARNLILESDIDLVLCGHIHECANCVDKIGRTTILNPSHRGKVITIK